MGKVAIGIDVGGTGIKAALVDAKKGELVSERIRVETPTGGRPNEIAEVVKKLVATLDPKGSAAAIGICFPAVVQHGVTKSAANISKEWIGLDADSLFTKLIGKPVHLINDADAAGVAEMKFGVGRKHKGLVMMTTLGTGIGTALFVDGHLVPNTELGHIEIDGTDYETKAAYSAKERENLTWPDWAKRLQIYYTKLEDLFTPDLFVVGGGVSKEHEDFLPLLKLRTEIVPAKLKNTAGIIGAAMVALKSSK
ncbi:MAG: polyphosphate--glucose phosphotransferase [Micrococcales bacterium]